MKPTITIIGLSALLACLTLTAQESQRPAGSGLADRFKQLDTNGEAFVTMEEALAFYAGRRRQPILPDTPASGSPTPMPRS